VASYGPLVYAVPVLIVVTVLVVFNVVRAPAPHTATTAPATRSPAPAALLVPNPGGPTVQADAAPTLPVPRVPSAELPAGGPFPVRGEGTFHAVRGTSDRVGQGEEFTYVIEVEDGIDLTDGEDAFATVVEATLSHPYSWIGSGQVALRRIDTGTPDLRISLASQQTARTECGFAIRYDTSCFLRTTGQVVLNAARWERGALAFQADIGRYRRYLINHETGHFFNNPHRYCPANGGLAPLMMQQTLTTANDELAALTADIQNEPVPTDGNVCRPNEWPYPAGRPG